jgi:hypothetical protein
MKGKTKVYKANHRTGIRKYELTYLTEPHLELEEHCFLCASAPVVRAAAESICRSRKEPGDTGRPVA